MARWPLVHPPLLGPAVLAPLAGELRARGEAVEVPDLRPAVATARDWPEDGARYVQLSAAYEKAAEDARSRGWPVVGHSTGAHLDIATDSARVADLLG